MAVLATAALAAAAYWSAARAPAGVDCPPVGPASLIVDAARHSMALCENGENAGTFSVRIGKHGTGKSREGDGKTPSGSYALGEPRASGTFGLFIPVDYPSAAQRSLGFTGGAIGVHGPHRRVRWLGRLVNTFDTTDGCIGLATDGEMQSVATWVRERRARVIVIQ